MEPDKDVQKVADVQLPADSSPEEQTTEEVQVPVEEVATETTEEQDQTAESNKGANQRIRELNQRAKAAEEKAQSLADRLAEVTNPQGFQAPQVPYTPQYEPGSEISQEQYAGDVSRQASALVDLKIKQNDAVNRINNESLNAVRKYDQLDPKSPNFDKELSDTVTESVEAQVRLNPYSASPEKIVDRLMKHYTGAVTKEVGQVRENITKQVSQAALRPTSIQTVEKTAKDKTLKELEAELGVVQS